MRYTTQGNLYFCAACASCGTLILGIKHSTHLRLLLSLQLRKVRSDSRAPCLQELSVDGLCSSTACCLGMSMKGWASTWVPSQHKISMLLFTLETLLQMKDMV